MAETGRREVVNDPLANNPYSQMPDRSLSTSGVRNPGQTSGAPNDPGFGALGDLGAALTEVLDGQKEDWTTEGKLQYMQGATEAEIAKTGNKYTMQGWQSLNTVDQSAKWFADEAGQINNGGFALSPEEYSKGLMQRRAEALKNLPADPAIRKLYVAAFDDYGPRLVAAHAEAHNAYNIKRTEDGYVSSLNNTSTTNADASRVMPGSPLRLSAGIVRPTVGYSDADVDTLALTILGEAGGEGPNGMAAVAHVIMNRAIDGGYGGKTITGVAKADKQFSTWNDGPGGNNPDRYVGTQAFHNARQIAADVLSGRNPDMTNGATHYYSPQGMAALVRSGAQTNLTPDWWNGIAGKTGSIQIGGHIFAGRAKGIGAALPVQTNGAKTGSIKFVHSGQESIDEGFAGILRDTSNALGRELTITSGYRPADHPVEARKKNGPGEHTQRDATDISMRGMDDNQRAALVQTLRARGAKRFGTYKNEPDMLHVDMNSKGVSGNDWFMYNGSNQNLGSAPAWFQQVAGTPIPPLSSSDASTGGRNAVETVPEDGAAPVDVAATMGVATAETPSGAQTQVQELARNFGNIPPQRRGQLSAQAIVDQMALGNDQLYWDLGGEQFLRELGTPEEVVQKVTQARREFEDKKLNGWNAEQMQWENDMVVSVQSGSLGASEAIRQIDSQVQTRRMTEEHAKSLGQKVLTASAQLGKKDIVTPEAMRGVTEIYRGVVTGVYTPEEAQAKVEELGKVTDMPRTQIDGLIQQMWNMEQSEILKSKNAVETAAKKKAEQDQRKAMVEKAIANGEGLDSLSNIGTIDAYDPKIGTTRSMSPAQYGVEEIRKKESVWAQDQIKQLTAAGMSEADATAQASAAAETRMYTQLRKHDVVDEAGARKIRGALIGDVVIKGPNGQLTASPAAQEALEFYVRMGETPEVGKDYMAKMLEDPQARTLVSVARTLMEGRYDVDDALVRAHQMLSDPNFDVDRRIAETGMFTSKVDAEVSKIVEAKIGEPSFWGTFMTPFDGQSQFLDENANDIRKNTAPVVNEVKRRAQAYFMQNPRMTMEAAVTMAAEDASNDATIAGTTIVFGNHQEGQRLDQVMGVSKFGRTAATDVIEHWMTEMGPSTFGDLFTQNTPSYLSSRGGRFVDNLSFGITSGQGFDHKPFAGFRDLPMYDVYYNTNSADPTIGVQLRDAKDMPVGPIQWLDAKTLGQVWMEDTGAKMGGAVSGAINDSLNFFVDMTNTIKFGVAGQDDGSITRMGGRP